MPLITRLQTGYKVDVDAILQQLRESHIQSLLVEKYELLAGRLFRLLLKLGKAEESQLVFYNNCFSSSKDFSKHASIIFIYEALVRSIAISLHILIRPNLQWHLRRTCEPCCFSL